MAFGRSLQSQSITGSKLFSINRMTRTTVLYMTNDRVTKARDELKNSSQKYLSKYNRNTKRNLDAVSLDEAYTEGLETHFKSKIDELNSLHNENKHAAAWPTVRELTNKRASPVIRVAGETTGPRISRMKASTVRHSEGCYHYVSFPSRDSGRHAFH